MNYNPFLPEVQVNLYPYYAYLRREALVYFVEAANMWAQRLPLTFQARA